MKVKFIKKIVATLCAATMATAAIVPSVGAVRLSENVKRKLAVFVQQGRYNFIVSTVDDLDKVLEIGKRFCDIYKDNQDLKVVVEKAKKLVDILDNWEIMSEIKIGRFGDFPLYSGPFNIIEGSLQDLNAVSSSIDKLCENIDKLRKCILLAISQNPVELRENDYLVNNFDRLFSDIRYNGVEGNQEECFLNLRKIVEERKALRQPLAQKENEVVSVNDNRKNNPDFKARLIAKVKEFGEKYNDALLVFLRLQEVAKEIEFLKSNENLSKIDEEVFALRGRIDGYDFKMNDENGLENRVEEYCRLVSEFLQKTNDYKRCFEKSQIEYDEAYAVKLQLEEVGLDVNRDFGGDYAAAKEHAKKIQQQELAKYSK